MSADDHLSAPQFNIKELSDNDLLTHYQDGHLSLDQTLDEAHRRDVRDRRARAHAKYDSRIRTSYEPVEHAQYLRADAATKGNMVNKLGVAHGISDTSLFSGSQGHVEKYATEELKNHFLDHPRMNFTQYRSQWRNERQAGGDSEL